MNYLLSAHRLKREQILEAIVLDRVPEESPARRQVGAVVDELAAKLVKVSVFEPHQDGVT